MIEVEKKIYHRGTESTESTEEEKVRRKKRAVRECSASSFSLLFSVLSVSLWLIFLTPLQADEPIAPLQKMPLFNGKDLAGFTTWLKDAKAEDPRKVFHVKDGILCLSGDGFGYLATDKAYRDYHLTAEFKWGKRTDGGKYVRNSGILLHATGPDGGANGVWMASIECQLAQGCVGDLICIRGKDAKGDVIPVSFASEVAKGKRPRWAPGGEKRVFTQGQLWWNRHDLDFKEFLDTRGKDDVESPLGEWTTVECICKGNTIRVKVNGQLVNHAFDVTPAAGKILLQTEGFEVFFRKVEIAPLAP